MALRPYVWLTHRGDVYFLAPCIHNYMMTTQIDWLTKWNPIEPNKLTSPFLQPNCKLAAFFAYTVVPNLSCDKKTQITHITEQTRCYKEQTPSKFTLPNIGWLPFRPRNGGATQSLLFVWPATQSNSSQGRLTLTSKKLASFALWRLLFGCPVD